MRRIATMTMAAAALLAVPATASAETVFVGATVLTDWSAAGSIDAITVTDGGAAYPGKILVRDASTPSGTPGYGCTDAGAAGIACTASIVTSTSIRTDDLDDTVTVDVAKASWIDGEAGNDTILGSASVDTVIGGDGNDVLDARGGGDNVYGGAGDDRIDARDGVKDDIDCGAGDDRATVDAVDVVVGCETDPVTGQTPVAENPRKKDDGGGDVTVPGAGDALTPPLEELRVALASLVAQVAAATGTASLDLSCAETEVNGCEGVVYLDPAPRGKAKGHAKGKAKGKAKGHAKALMARRGRYGKSPFVIAAGKSRKLDVKLTPLARKALGLKPSKGKARAARRGRRVKAVVTVVHKGHAATRSVVELRG